MRFLALMIAACFAFSSVAVAKERPPRRTKSKPAKKTSNKKRSVKHLENWGKAGPIGPIVIVCPSKVTVRAKKNASGLARLDFDAQFHSITHTKAKINYEGYYRCRYTFTGSGGGQVAPVPYYQSTKVFPKGGWENLPCTISGRKLRCESNTQNGELGIPNQRTSVPTPP